MRGRAIACALFYGIVPWPVYERTCHYAPMGYWPHLAMNLNLAWRWLRGRETATDVEFEREINAPRRRAAA